MCVIIIRTGFENTDNMTTASCSVCSENVARHDVGIFNKNLKVMARWNDTVCLKITSATEDQKLKMNSGGYMRL